MNRTSTFHRSFTLPLTMLASIALSAGVSSALGQTIASPAAQSSVPTIVLTGPTGERLTLVHSSDAGWQLQAGWPSVQTNAPRPTEAVFSNTAPPEADQPVLEQPLTVFVDGPTGYTFIYLLDEGWKFVGRVAESNR